MSEHAVSVPIPIFFGKRKTQQQSFDANITRTEHSECWIWHRSRDKDGYGRLWNGKRTVLAHRFSWMLANHAPIPAGHIICHSCDTPSCVNPAHLWLGTTLENQRDSWAKGRKDPTLVEAMIGYNSSKQSCPKGHPYTLENTYTYKKKSGGYERHCRECRRLLDKQRGWKRGIYRTR